MSFAHLRHQQIVIKLVRLYSLEDALTEQNMYCGFLYIL